MACGFTPDLARMLQQMSVEKDKQAQEVLKEAEQQVARARAKHEKTQKLPNEGYDWTRTYEKWDAWEDPEELARQEQEARERSERAAKAQMSCNHDHSAEQKLMDMTTKEKMTACDEFRVLGNLFFQHGQYQRAAYHYHKALVYFEYLFPDTEEEEKEADQLKLKLLLNFAACRLKTMHLDDAVHHANQALELDADNVKALYRRAQAYRLKDEFELAMKDISKAIELSAEQDGQVDTHLVQEKALLQAKMLAYKLRTKQVSAAMFGNGQKVKAERAAASYVPGLRAPDASAMAIDLSKNSRAASTTDDLPSLDAWQPSTQGLRGLQSLLTQLDG